MSNEPQLPNSPIWRKFQLLLFLTILGLAVSIFMLFARYYYLQNNSIEQQKTYSTPPYQWDTVEYTIWSDSAIGGKIKILYNEEFIRVNDSIDIAGEYIEIGSSNKDIQRWRFIGEGHKIDIFRDHKANDWIHWTTPKHSKIIAKDKRTLK